MQNNHWFKTGFLSFAASLLLIGCASEPTTEQEENAGDAGGEAIGDSGGGDLILGVLSDISMLDPHTSSDVPSGAVQSNIYETLVKFNSDMELEPLLAESWEAVEEDVWEFRLQEGVTFHDGSEFNGDVVKANIERILDETTASPRAILFEIIEEIEVIDSHTVRMKTEQPFAPLPAHFAHYASSMISLKAIEADQAAVESGEQPGTYINEHPYGTGAFTFENWNPGTEVILSRFDDYWGEPAHVDTATFRVIPEDLTRLAELETGGVHIIDPVQASDRTRVENTDGMNLYQRNAASITYMGFNVQKEPLDNELVRQAIALALDKDAMLQGVLDGTGEPAVGPINETNFGFSSEVAGIEQDVERARELLAEAGYEEGFSTTIWTNDNRERMDIAEIAQANLAEVGIDANIEVVEWGAYLELTGSGNHDLFILGLSLGTGDADYPMHMLFHSENIGETGNRSFFQDEAFDAMLHEARIEQDEETRLQMYMEATEYLNEKVPMAFLYHPDHLMGYRDEVQGFWADASGIYQLKDVSLKQ
ncbi:glutathione ABC transporter substrate-binding protein [Halalkalibacterium halodurans]|uniref:glutathione ABC transporter substrate-binding protein n=1 Tax=Halalkalibacterium halodurans TaxID=86665 RepID=UPI002E20D901|nr:glutathione ABC transporter substrate-binding protein [Halalkalibacterium halodurans]MED4086503.1 glutathione ABC transporter substrate-binding protein [Halalkalibacterium halodurans]MED4104788.1 glutathione ABC transporter substrate-binding protein [Halalkalibacterium halodurans]MED4109635.1 glutathione ABC transporter substrate-binding protein [Halalkalibacterium halodurans]MED4150086.1 glutathione ABC transporter substrate-binding protein [Halalkalibacterium halodurans]